MRRYWTLAKAIYYRHKALKPFVANFRLQRSHDAPDSERYLEELREKTYLMKTEKVKVS